MSVKDILRKYNIQPKKRMGQNFLIDEPTLEKIVRTLAPTNTDKVIEIGPGIGVMTRILTECAKFVAAVDADKDMIKILETELGERENLHIIHGDILDVNFSKLLTEGKWLFIGNIPYNITSPLLFHIRDSRHLFKRGVLTIQKEVAHRLTAKPGGKDYGILSIAMQAVANIEICFDIGRRSFFPEPDVTSSVIKIIFPDKPKYNINDMELFSNVVRAAFSTRRKKLKNALEQSNFLKVTKDEISEAISKTAIDANARAEELDIETFVRLTDNLANSRR